MLKAFWISSLVVIGMFACSYSYGQTNKPLRLEFEARSNARPYNLILLGDKGLIMYYKQAQPPEKGMDHWFFKYFDIYLNEVWERNVEIGAGFAYAKHFFRNDSLYIAYYNKPGGKASIQLLTVNLKEGNAKSNYFEVGNKAEINRFLIHNNKVFFATTDKRFVSRLHIGDLEDGSLKNLTILEKYESWIDDIDIDSINNQLLLTIQYHGQKGGNIITLYQIDFDGEILKSTEIDDGSDKKMLISCDLTIVDSTTRLLLGSYTVQSRQKSYSQDHPSMAKALGIASAVLKGEQQGKMNYYKFSDFNNFYDHLTYDDVSRMKKNKDHKPAVDFQVLPHSSIKYRGGYVYLLEAYFPKYQYLTRTEYDFYGRPYPYSYSVFQGYQYTNAFISWFDTLGIKQWDNNFEISSILEDRLSKRVSLLFDGPDVVMTYHANGEIAAQVINEDVALGGLEYYPLDPLFKGDAIIENYEGSIVYWYDNFVLCYGYQKLSNPSNRNVPKRTVFYFNKMAYR